MIKIGDIYPDRSECKAVDCAKIVHRHGKLFQFLMYLQDPSNNEIEQVKHGRIKYGVYTQSLSLFFIVQFDSIILDSPINVYEMPAFSYTGNGLNSHAATLLLIKSTSNQIMAIRRLLLPETMVDVIVNGCRLQQQFLTVDEIDEISHKIAMKHSPLDMLKEAKVYSEENARSEI